jgi:hypothetical protein
MIREDVYEAVCDGVGWARFVLGHEFGHFIFHRLTPAPKRVARCSPDRNAEHHSDTFANRLLIPPTHYHELASIEEAALKCGVAPDAVKKACPDLLLLWDRKQNHPGTDAQDKLIAERQYNNTSFKRPPTRQSRNSAVNTEALASEFDKIGAAVAQSNMQQDRKRILLRHITYLAWAVRHFESMSIEGIRNAFAPAALPGIVEAGDDTAEVSGGPNLYQWIVNAGRKALGALDLIDRGLRGIDNVKNDMQDLFD